MVSALGQSGSGRRPRDIAPLWISSEHLLKRARAGLPPVRARFLVISYNKKEVLKCLNDLSLCFWPLECACL